MARHSPLRREGVIGLKNIFLKDWYYATGTWPETEEEVQEDIYHPGEFMVVESGPDYENMIIKDIYFKMINSAKRSIKIQTPYLILEPEMLQALKNAAKSGVIVEIIVPGKPDKVFMSLATKSYYDVLLETGVRIYEYINVFIHSKVMIIDDYLASVGTVNFDPRSFNLNFEATAIIRDSSVDQLVYDFYEDRNRSNEILLNEWRKRPILLKYCKDLLIYLVLYYKNESDVIKMMTKQDARRILGTALATGGDFAEVFMETTISNVLEITSREVTKALTQVISGVSVRIIKDFKEVFGYTNDKSIASIEKLAAELASSFDGSKTTDVAPFKKHFMKPSSS